MGLNTRRFRVKAVVVSVERLHRRLGERFPGGAYVALGKGT